MAGEGAAQPDRMRRVGQIGEFAKDLGIAAPPESKPSAAASNGVQKRAVSRKSVPPAENRIYSAG
jgi:hypothetical protein